MNLDFCFNFICWKINLYLTYEGKICVMLWGQSCCVVIQWRNLLLQDYDSLVVKITVLIMLTRVTAHCRMPAQQSESKLDLNKTDQIPWWLKINLYLPIWINDNHCLLVSQCLSPITLPTLPFLPSFGKFWRKGLVLGIWCFILACFCMRMLIS